jgi:hypothetical protein
MLICNDRLTKIGLTSDYVYNFVTDSQFISGMIMHFMTCILTLQMVCPFSAHAPFTGSHYKKNEVVDTKKNCAFLNTTWPMVLLWERSFIYSLCYRHRSVIYEQVKCKEVTYRNHEMTCISKKTTYDIKQMDACYQSHEIVAFQHYMV